jgi:hypothetical protein
MAAIGRSDHSGYWLSTSRRASDTSIAGGTDEADRAVARS